MYGIPRGILNNNPTNIRKSAIPWHNKIVPSRDADFEQFQTAYDGLHAGALNVCNYYRLHGLQTVQDIIKRLAPSSENDTAAYIRDVAARLSIKPDARINVLDASVLSCLVMSVIYHENGECPYDAAQIAAAVNAVLLPMV